MRWGMTDSWARLRIADALRCNRFHRHRPDASAADRARRLVWLLGTRGRSRSRRSPETGRLRSGWGGWACWCSGSDTGVCFRGWSRHMLSNTGYTQAHNHVLRDIASAPASKPFAHPASSQTREMRRERCSSPFCLRTQIRCMLPSTWSCIYSTIHKSSAVQCLSSLCIRILQRACYLQCVFCSRSPVACCTSLSLRLFHARLCIYAQRPLLRSSLHYAFCCSIGRGRGIA